LSTLKKREDGEKREDGKRGKLRSWEDKKMGKEGRWEKREVGKPLDRWQRIRGGNPGNPVILQILVQTWVIVVLFIVVASTFARMRHPCRL
jgi:hypothetical protein